MTVFYSQWNPFDTPWWTQMIFAAGAVLLLALVYRMHCAYAFTAAGRQRQEVQRARQASYERRRRERHDRRPEDLLWAISREQSYELAVGLALGRLNREGVRLIESIGRRRHLEVIA